MPQMFQQALWFGGKGEEDQGQEVDLLKSMTGPSLKGARPLSISRKAVLNSSTSASSLKDFA